MATALSATFLCLCDCSTLRVVDESMKELLARVVMHDSRETTHVKNMTCQWKPPLGHRSSHRQRRSRLPELRTNPEQRRELLGGCEAARVTSVGGNQEHDGTIQPQTLDRSQETILRRTLLPSKLIHLELQQINLFLEIVERCFEACLYHGIDRGVVPEGMQLVLQSSPSVLVRSHRQ